MFGWFKGKRGTASSNTSAISDAFRKLREDLHQQRAYLDSIHIDHSDFKKNTVVNHKRISDWIKHFDTSIKILEKDLKLLETNIKEDFDKVTKTSLDLFQEVHSKYEKNNEALKKEILKEVEVFLENKPKKEVSEPIINVSNDNNVNNVMHNASYDALSNPEMSLVSFLFDSENPVSYSQISEKTGKSVNTVRVYMNQLKNKGFVDESSLPNGVKLFSLKHKAKVKKLYNL
jgi:biotin operon repressor